MAGWRQARQAARAMPHLTRSTVAAVLAVGLLNSWLGHLILFGGLGPIELIAARLVQMGVSQLVWASCAIAVHRYVLLDEVRDRPIWQTPPQFWRFFDRLVILQLIMGLPTLVLFGSPAHPGLNWLLFEASTLIGVIVALRSMLLFPAVATDAPGTGWRNAWRDSKGQGWRLFRVAFCLGVPIMPVYLGVFVLGGSLFGIRALLLPLSPWGLVQTGMLESALTASIWAAAAAASLLYRSFAATLAQA